MGTCDSCYCGFSNHRDSTYFVRVGFATNYATKNKSSSLTR